jgi:hypothetical protein
VVLHRRSQSVLEVMSKAARDLNEAKQSLQYANALLVQASAMPQQEGVQVPEGVGRALQHIYVTPGACLSQLSSGSIDIQKGGVFTKLSQDMEFKTPFGNVTAGKGAIVCIRVENGETHVQSCGGKGSVEVKANGQTVPLTVGTELILSAHANDTLAELTNDGIARRGLSPILMGMSLKGFLYEFSMVSLLGQLEAVKQPATPYEKQLAMELVKTAAILQQVVGPRGTRYIVPNGPTVPQFDGRLTEAPVKGPSNSSKGNMLSVN